jgi:ANTAR domain
MLGPAPRADVAAAFAALAQALASDSAVEPYLTAVCGNCVRLAGAQSAAIVYAAGSAGALTALAASDQRGQAIARAALGADASPWLECARSGHLITIANLALREKRWPWFRAMAADAGFTAVTLVPVGPQPGARGALALLGGTEPDAAQILIALSLADVAAAGLSISAVIHQQQAAIRQLQAALSSRVLIEQAKGVLSERWHVAPDEAFDVLRRHARASHQSLAGLAGAVVTGTAQLSWTGSG